MNRKALSPDHYFGTHRSPANSIFAFLLAALLFMPASWAESAEITRLSFWFEWSSQDKDYLLEIVRQYESQNPQVKIETLLVPFGELNQKLLPAVAAGIPPDIVIFNRPAITQWAAENAFTPLDSFAQRDGVVAEDFLESCWDECVSQDRLWAIPLNTDNRIFYWNKKIFREAGLDPDRPPRTWRELEDFAEKLTLTDAAGRLQQVGFYPLWGDARFYLYAYQKGVRFFSEDGRRAIFNSPEAVETLEWILSYARKYRIQSLASFSSAFGPIAQNPFMTGKVAMIADGSWMPKYWLQYAPDLEFGAAPVPVPEDGRLATWSAGFSLAIPRNVKDPEQAWHFIKFCTSYEAQIQLAQMIDAFPVRKEALEAVKDSMPEAWQVSAEMMLHDHSLPKSPVTLGAFWDAIDRAGQEVVYERKSPQKALDDAVADTQAALDRFYAYEQYPLVNWRYVVWLAGTILVLALLFVFARIRRELICSPARRSEALAGYFLASPWFIGFGLFIAGPLIASLVLGFCDYRVLSPARWVGFHNYQSLFQEDPLFWKSLGNTIYYCLLAVPLGVTGALGLAILLNQPVRGIHIFRTIFYMPSVISGVAVCVLWMWIFNPEYGILNAMLAWFNIRGPGWLSDIHWAKPAIVIMSLWGIGGGMIIFLAALQDIPSQLYDAARVDGAGTWRQFIHVTLPLLTPAIFFNLVIGFIGSFQVFTQAYIMTNGGPLDSTLFYALYLFHQAFRYFRMGYASAMAWILFAILLILTLIQMRFAKRWVHYEEEAR